MFSAMCLSGIAFGCYGIVYGIKKLIREDRELEQLLHTLKELEFKESFSCPEFDSNGLIINW